MVKLHFSTFAWETLYSFKTQLDRQSSSGIKVANYAYNIYSLFVFILFPVALLHSMSYA